jgi:ASC-1-like (ASCH) protein
MNYNMKLTQNPFQRVSQGLKTLEVRLYDSKRQKLCLGDTITFFELPDLTQSITVQVIGLTRCDTFKDLFTIFGNNFFGYKQPLTVEQQVLAMRKVYSESDEKQFGVLGIHIQGL